MSKRTWTDEQLIEVVKTSGSIRESAIRLGLVGAGGSYTTITRRIKELCLDTKHFEERRKNQLRELHTKRHRNLDEILVENSYHTSHALKKRLLKENILEEKCECCGMFPFWNNKPISLHLEHKNGIHQDNRLENLCLLCPNCHSQTSTYCGKNKKKKDKPQLITVLEERKQKQPYPPRPKKPHKTKITWCSNEELAKLVWEYSTTNIAKMFGVSDKAIEKRCKKFNIPKPPRGYWAKIYATPPVRIELTPSELEVPCPIR